MHKVLRLPDVIECTGLSRSAIYANIVEGTFPSQISLGPRTVGWLETEVLSWLETKIVESRPVTDADGGTCASI